MSGGSESVRSIGEIIAEVLKEIRRAGTEPARRSAALSVIRAPVRGENQGSDSVVVGCVNAAVLVRTRRRAAMHLQPREGTMAEFHINAEAIDIESNPATDLIEIDVTGANRDRAVVALNAEMSADLVTGLLHHLRGFGAPPSRPAGIMNDLLLAPAHQVSMGLHVEHGPNLILEFGPLKLLVPIPIAGLSQMQTQIAQCMASAVAPPLRQ
jgi:hypothetical protein